MNRQVAKMQKIFSKRVAFCVLGILASWRFISPALSAGTNDYVEVDALFTKHCLDCHESKDPESNLVLENFETAMKGGQNGVVIVPG